jgi:hypothetical protein
MPEPHVLVRCQQCDAVVLQCRCPGPHVVREVPCCGRCTCTGGEVVVDEEQVPHA